MLHTRESDIYKDALFQRGVLISDTEAFVVKTGKHTGRAANDKFIVDEPASTDSIGWGKINRPISEEHFEKLLRLVKRHLNAGKIYSQQLYAGSEVDSQLSVRLYTESAWHSIAARHLLLTKNLKNKDHYGLPFTIYHSPSCKASPEKHGTNSETFIVIHPSRRIAIIGGTGYFGEIKKSVFTMMNYLLPEQDVLPMHCSANVGLDGDSALFFGLSGTGKTTLSADGKRILIGDDEHGWSSGGVFNFEGGCYAKTIKLSEQNEPQIWKAVNTRGTVIENVAFEPETNKMDFDSPLITENGRAAYPLDYLDNVELSGVGGHPKNVFFLTCDAFGVLPPIARLTPEQAMYHFLSGYTAKVAGTEQGITEPTATFSACFGEPFMPRPPVVYANLLGERLKKHKSNCWLVNTGWSGGSYGTGKRMEIDVTRKLLDAALSGELDRVSFKGATYFGISIPTSCPGVDSAILNPYPTWEDRGAYRTKALELVELFHQNFQRFDDIPKAIKNSAPGM